MTSYTKHCNSDSLFNTQLVNTLLYPNLASSCGRCQTLPRVDKHTLYARLSKGHRRITHSIRAARCYFVLKQLSMQERQKLMNQFPTAVIVFALHQRRQLIISGRRVGGFIYYERFSFDFLLYSSLLNCEGGCRALGIKKMEI